MIAKAVTLYSFDSKTISSLKNFAFLFMLIDHIGIILYPEFTALRIIGRIAFPLFAFITIYNFTFNTNDKNNQILNIFLLALISQYVYVFAIGFEYLNIFFSFLLVLTFIHVLNSFKSTFIIGFSFISLFSLSYFVEYGFYGFLYMFSIYLLFINSTKNTLYIIFMIPALSFLINGYTNLMALSVTLLTTILLIFVYFENINISFFSYRFNKYFYYGFYPVHLFLLSLS